MQDKIASKTTLILTGGGMRCAWSGGLLYGLNEIGIRPQKIIANSGSVGNAVYFATNQSESIRNIWTKHLPGKRFISFSRFKKLSISIILLEKYFVLRNPLIGEHLRKAR